MTVFDRIKKLADDQQISIVELEERLGFGRNSLYSWKKKMPNSGNLEKVADYFGVTTDYLLGRGTKDSPDWATDDDKIDLDKWLQSNVPMGFQGMDMNDETKIKVRAFLEGVFWEDKQKHRNDDNKK